MSNKFANKFGLTTLVKDHLIAGKPITRLEAMLIYGISNLTPRLTELKQDGYIVKSRTIPLAAAIRRVNKYAMYQPPQNLPVKDILYTEWWVSS
ncbi:MAG TPA: hypothetical protein DCG42_05440 [Maribacter sp.]|nr:hypothetical protein [Maribacter sp.]